ncbi:ATP-binding protein [Coemansia sp. RSA 552]|nr:ATP-binding protein [Coemansia sp. RSA 552]
MASRLLLPRRLATFGSPSIVYRPCRQVSTSVALRKAGREWNYIDGPGSKISSQKKSAGARVKPKASSGSRPSLSGSQTQRGDGEAARSPSVPEQNPPSSSSGSGMEPISPRMIMRYLDEYVIGQERAKKALAVAVYNHYNRVRANALRRQREQLAAAFAAANQPSSSAQQQGAGSNGRGGPAYASTAHQYPFANRPWGDAYENSHLFVHPADVPVQQSQQQAFRETAAAAEEIAPGVAGTQLDKSNVLLLGPSGSGKTLLAKTLAQVLDVPFSVSDATPLTQAGYVGEDVEVVIQRLLQSCDYDVARAEQGIVFIDEIDKIARKPDSFSMSKDVSGEGVQQGLLRMLEGTVVTVTDKSGHGSHQGPPSPPSPPTPFAPHGQQGPMSQNPPSSSPSSAPLSSSPINPTRRGSPLSGAFGPGSGMPGGTGGPIGGGGGGSKGDVYQVDTSNILFILSGAFVGLDRVVMDRVSKASIGFGNPVRKLGDTASPVDRQAMAIPPVSFSTSGAVAGSVEFNPLEYVEPRDLINFGLIPEFIGRLPVVTSVGALDKDALVRVLVEPKNALVRQYEALLALSGAQLRITRPALLAIAQQAIEKQTGARGLRRIMENLLLEPMFDCPGSSVKYVVIDGQVAQFKKRPLYFSKIQETDVEAAVWADEQGDAAPERTPAEPKRSAATSA